MRIVGAAVAVFAVAACSTTRAPVCPPADFPTPTPTPTVTASVPKVSATPSRPSPPTVLGLDAWRAIRFVDVVDAFGARTSFTATLRREATGMQLALTARGPGSDPLARVTVRVYVADAAPTTVKRAPFLGVANGPSGRAPTRLWTAFFTVPWQGAPLDEAFVEADLGTERYWLEVPYGFVAGPRLTARATDPRTTPKRPPAMARLGPHDHWVPFRDVGYDLGVIQNGWRLSARLANPFDAHAELELYRDDGAIGQSAFLWGLHEPRTSAEILEANGRTLQSLPMELRLHEDGMRRSDDFHFDRSGAGTRAVGTFRATVGDHVVLVPIPSSLYAYTHGTADPYDPHRVVTAAGVLGDALF